VLCSLYLILITSVILVNLFCCFFFFFLNDPATTEIYTLSLHDALPIWLRISTRPMSDCAVILVVEDREDDILLLRNALRKANLANPVHFVRDGEEAVAYLR